MARVLLHLAYRGTAYHGWQTQTAGLPTVQSTLEAALAAMLGYRAHLHGCGRTDAGVHATNYYAHLDLRTPLDFDPVQRLCHLLPSDIAVYRWIAVDQKIHAQRSAAFRRYDYLIGLCQNPFQADYRAQMIGSRLDVTKMQAVIGQYGRATDFRAFCRRPEQYKSTHCRIDACSLTIEENGGLLRFSIQANRFLQNMVRLLVARAIDVGLGRMEVDDIAAALSSGLAPKHLRPAPAQGLSLVAVGYGIALE